MNIRRKIITGISWSAAEKWGSQLVAFLIFLALARLLKPEAFGLVAMASVFIHLGTLVIESGMMAAIIQKDNLTNSHLNTMFWFNITAGLLLYIACILLAGFISDVYNEPKFEQVFKCLALVFPLTAFGSTQRAILTRKMKFKALSINSLAARIIGGIVGVACAVTGLGPFSLVYQQLCGSCIAIFLLWKISDWRPAFHFSTTHFRELAAFSLSVLGQKLIDFLDTRFDHFIIAYYLGSTVLGYYSIACRVLDMVTVICIGVVGPVTFSAFSNLKKDREKLTNVFYGGTEYLCIIILPLFAGLYTVAPDLILSVLGEKWENCIVLIRIMAFTAFLHSILSYNSSLIIALGYPHHLLKIRIVSSVFIVIGYLLVVKHGIAYVALVYCLISYFVTAPWHINLLRKVDIELRRYFKLFIPAVVCCLAMVAGITLLKGVMGGGTAHGPRLAMCIVFGSVVYCAVLFRFYPSYPKRCFGIVHRLRQE